MTEHDHQGPMDENGDPIMPAGDEDLSRLEELVRRNNMATVVFPRNDTSQVKEQSQTYHRHRLLQAIENAGYAVGYLQMGEGAIITVNRSEGDK